MDKRDEQLWLFPEVGESVDEYRRLGYGVKKEAEVFRVPEIIMDPEVRSIIKAWPIEISSRRVRITKPYALFAELPERDLLDFKDYKIIDKVYFTKVAESTIKMEFNMQGEQKKLFLTLEDNGKVREHFDPNENI